MGLYHTKLLLLKCLAIYVGRVSNRRLIVNVNNLLCACTFYFKPSTYFLHSLSEFSNLAEPFCDVRAKSWNNYFSLNIQWSFKGRANYLRKKSCETLADETQGVSIRPVWGLCAMCVCPCVCIHVHVWMRLSVHVYTHMCLSMHTCVCLCACILAENIAFQSL